VIAFCSKCIDLKVQRILSNKSSFFNFCDVFDNLIVFLFFLKRFYLVLVEISVWVQDVESGSKRFQCLSRFLSPGFFLQFSYLTSLVLAFFS
jgi:hypothetical protein